jgi:hypothetical protein
VVVVLIAVAPTRTARIVGLTRRPGVGVVLVPVPPSRRAARAGVGVHGDREAARVVPEEVVVDGELELAGPGDGGRTAPDVRPCAAADPRDEAPRGSARSRESAVCARVRVVPGVPVRPGAHGAAVRAHGSCRRERDGVAVEHEPGGRTRHRRAADGVRGRRDRHRLDRRRRRREHEGQGDDAQGQALQSPHHIPPLNAPPSPFGDVRTPDIGSRARRRYPSNVQGMRATRPPPQPSASGRRGRGR